MYRWLPRSTTVSTPAPFLSFDNQVEPEIFSLIHCERWRHCCSAS